MELSLLNPAKTSLVLAAQLRVRACGHVCVCVYVPSPHPPLSIPYPYPSSEVENTRFRVLEKKRVTDQWTDRRMDGQTLI